MDDDFEGREGAVMAVYQHQVAAVIGVEVDRPVEGRVGQLTLALRVREEVGGLTDSAKNAAVGQLAGVAAVRAGVTAGDEIMSIAAELERSASIGISNPG